MQNYLAFTTFIVNFAVQSAIPSSKGIAVHVEIAAKSNLNGS